MRGIISAFVLRKEKDFLEISETFFFLLATLLLFKDLRGRLRSRDFIGKFCVERSLNRSELFFRESDDVAGERK